MLQWGENIQQEIIDQPIKNGDTVPDYYEILRSLRVIKNEMVKCPNLDLNEIEALILKIELGLR